ncbi:hydrolase [Bacterioplanes sanyensis]|uniref:alpha/beta fold hydrolase n=1 Tax=Bacterioplanes sanyensis TaxID=1249553 RepID=UPI00167A9194|nr:alpha/beta fold hydrolase [Bacterioplanes sanyensis]GGY41012.1 hydrolase [Bacterioplanes sanyensis]
MGVDLMSAALREETLGSLAALHSPRGALPTLMLHGWMDNAASFHQLAPQLAVDGWALDLPGHGHSPWLAEGADYYVWSYLPAVLQALDTLHQQSAKPVLLIAHSMGTASALQAAALAPDQVAAVVLIDGIGPLTTPAASWIQQMQQALAWQPKPARRFDDPLQALAARQRSSPDLDAEALEVMVRRNLQAIGEGWQWRTDPRLKAPSKVRLTDDMVKAALQTVNCRVLAIRAEHGIVPQPWWQQRLGWLRDVDSVVLPGHHHLHLEPATSGAVALCIEQFIAGD